jgi:hypothetical protein
MIDPAERLWFVYSQSLIKKLGGVRATVISTYIVGFGLVAIGVIELGQNAILLARGLGLWP